ncbi:bestrophin family ion channel [Sediminibacter sp. Hel_I_10]|uniref:bestrophin family ion channel n=1 Tax=Sediminibacter sp. Hel_I_10 TaxID=1392490 RepID=UPI00047BE376|nr:bestrophin family ion channel [Sediminibacter sp. Hel_I_10]
MIRTEKQGFRELLIIVLPYFVLCAAYATMVVFLEEYFGDHILKLSAQIGSVFGLAVAFFLGFRMNSAYDRWWEARKIFGELTNTTRSFSAKIYTYIQTPSNLVADADNSKSVVASELMDLTCCFINQLKNEIHEKPHPSYTEEAKLLFEIYNIDLNNKVSNEILMALSLKIEQIFSDKANFEKSDLMQHINQFYNIQGKAERINNTPFLKIYSAFTRVTVTIYVLMIPFIIGDIDIGGEESYLELLAIPLFAIVSTLFLTINKLANLYGDPLEENKTSVPIEKICQNIIANCQEVKRKW